jgi:hypothetical protein
MKKNLFSLDLGRHHPVELQHDKAKEPPEYKLHKKRPKTSTGIKRK